MVISFQFLQFTASDIYVKIVLTKTLIFFNSNGQYPNFLPGSVSRVENDPTFNGILACTFNLLRLPVL